MSDLETEQHQQVLRLRRRAVENLRWFREDGARWVRDGVDETVQLIARGERMLQECDILLLGFEGVAAAEL